MPSGRAFLETRLSDGEGGFDSRGWLCAPCFRSVPLQAGAGCLFKALSSMPLPEVLTSREIMVAIGSTTVRRY